MSTAGVATIRIFILLGLVSLLGFNPAYAQTETPTAVRVRAQALSELLIYPEASAPASVVSLAASRISSELSAVIADLPVKIADVVEAGALLARLDCTDHDFAVQELNARLAMVIARLGLARKQFERAQSLRQQGTMAAELAEQREADFSGLQAEHRAHKIALDRAEHQRSKCTIRAPFRAAIVERSASLGEYVTPGTPLLQIVALDEIEVSARLLTQDASALGQAEGLVFRHQARSYPLQLRAISPVIDAASRDREVRLRFSADKALPGASGRLLWSHGAAIAADLLVRRGQTLGVLLALNGRATFHPLAAAQEGRPAQIKLPPDLLVITAGHLGLSDGDLITLAP